jgi:hypothetical protein
MIDAVNVVLTLPLVAALVWAGIQLFGPKLIDQRLQKNLRDHQSILDRKLEEFKVTTQAKADAQLEIARAEMARSAHEHRVRFTRLHEQRAKVISGVFARLDRLHRAISSLTQVIDTGQERPMTYATAFKSYREFQDFYYERAIWLDQETVDLINPIVDLLVRPLSTLAVVKDRNVDDLRRAIQETRRIVDEHVPAARKGLEERFRRLLEAGEQEVKNVIALDGQSSSTGAGRVVSSPRHE